MNLKKLILTNNDCYKRGEKITPKGIMVHSTGANNPNLKRYVGPDDGLLGVNKYNNHWNTSGLAKCVHAFIGKLKDGSIATYQTLPWTCRGWHSGKGKNGSANNTHIGFEICEDGMTDAVYFKKVYQEAVELTAMLCKQYNLNPLADGVVISHKEGYTRGIASAHGDPDHWFQKHGKSMDTFRKDVDAAMRGTSTTNVPTKAETKGENTVNIEMTVLKKGSKGEQVKTLQRLLMAMGYNLGGYGADGSFGSATDKAVRAYQKAKGVAVDGSVGKTTWTKLLKG